MEPTKDRFDLENEITSTINYSEMLNEIVEVMESDTREIHVDEVVEALRGISVILGVHTDKMFDTFKQVLLLDEYRPEEDQEDDDALMNNRINGVTFYEFIGKAVKAHDDFPDWRFGQAVMNTLATFSPYLWGRVVKTDNLDCYYNDDLVDNTLDFLREEWIGNGIPDEDC